MVITISINKIRTPATLESKVLPLPSEAAICAFEEKLGYALPSAYREFLKKYNGGSNASGAVDGVDDDSDTPYMYGDQVRDFYSLDAGEDYARLKLPSLSPFDGWPDYALPIADDSFGNMFVLLLGEGRGEVLFVEHDVEDADGLGGLRSRLLADDFTDFLSRFESRKDYKARLKKEEDEDYQADLESLTDGALPKLLRDVCKGLKTEFPTLEERLRSLCLKVLKQKGYFALHADEDSVRVYDLVFWAYQQKHPLKEWKETYEALMWGSNGEFGISGYAPGFVEDWWNGRIAEGALVADGEEYRFTKAFSDAVRKENGL